MKLLIITQKVDSRDPVLGFFHRWLEEFAESFERIIVICLEMGEYRLPPNVKVLSLGKERGVSKLEYAWNFYKYIWQERRDYDNVFVHMNQEYVLLAADMWRMMGKRVYLWRNHPHGDLLTRVAIFLSNKVFCTSTQSFTARFGKTVIMPAGIDTDFFSPDPSISRKPRSVLFLGRIGPMKKVLEFVEWLHGLAAEGKRFSATIAGSAQSGDREYGEAVSRKVAEYGLSDKVSFVGAVSQAGARDLYRSHELYVNFTPSGSLDKTILEAAACETALKVSNGDLKFLEGKPGRELRDFVIEHHSLKLLVAKLKREMQ